MASYEYEDNGAYSYSAGSYAAETPSYGQDVQYEAEFYALDAEAQAVCFELAPEFQGDAVSLGDLDELCRHMRRPVRDDNERTRLLTLLDPENAMQIQRVAFTTWLLQDLYLEKQLRDERLMGPAPTSQHVGYRAPQPAWEEITDEATPTSKYYYNTLTGETAWALPSQFVASLANYLVNQDEMRALKAPTDAQGFLELPARDAVEELRQVFQKFDDDRSDSLDTSEFQDLCVAVGFLLGSDSSVLLATMLEIDPASGASVVTWDALQHYWLNNAPFQRRTKLLAPWDPWERVESLSSRTQMAVFRHVATQTERWSHPQTEQNAVELLTKMFPSSKLEWKQRIAMFYELQLKPDDGETAKPSGDSDAKPVGRMWTLGECRVVLTLLGVDCTRREFVKGAVKAIRAKHGQGTGGDAEGLDQATVENWLEHCVTRVEMGGWDELVDEASGQRYYYHETQGLTQWDPPHLENRMAMMMKRFGGDASGSNEENIKRIFRHYDVDESGSISLDEFKRLYVALLGRKEAVSGENEADDKHIQQVFAVLDTSGDDEVSLEEFMVWWKTKMNLEDEETDQQKQERVVRERKRIALEFLRHHDGLIETKAVPPSTQTESGDGSVGEDEIESYRFDSNMLPRLVGVLGKYSLQGLAYRNALNTLVRTTNIADQEILLSDFLEWYAAFEQAEKEKEELAAQRARALALLQTQEAEAKEKARKLKMIRKGQLLTKTIASDAAVGGVPESAEFVWRRHVETLFRKFDKDSSGYLDAQELQELTRALGHELSDAQIKQMMAVMDSSGDERVSLDEFLTFWTAFQRRQRATATKAKVAEKTAAPADEPHRREAISMVQASATMAVNMELAKDRALKVSVDDIKEALGDWKESILDRPRKRREAKELAEQERLRHEELRRQWASFVPTKKRRYAHFDVTWIEPEIVRCVVDIIGYITRHAKPLPRQDAAQRIQRIMRGVVTRMHSFAMIRERLRAYVDVDTSCYYYVDSENHGRVWLYRPLFPTITSSVSPFELGDCRTKVDKLLFKKRQREMKNKQQYFAQHAAESSITTVQWKAERRLYVPATFVMFTVIDKVRLRLLGNIWLALREKSFVLAELMAQRHYRQLTQRSNSDASTPLPLHYVVQHHREVPFRLIQAIYKGFPEAVREKDAYGRTPLHLALREHASFQVVELLLSQRGHLIVPATRTAPQHCVWQIQSSTGETPLHVALKYRVSLELLRWICQHKSFVSRNPEQKLWQIRNNHGAAVFHLVVGSLFTEAQAAYWRSVVLVLLRTWPSSDLCGFVDRKGDLPLHLAIERYASVTQQRVQNKLEPTRETDAQSWCWLIETLTDLYPQALLAKRRHDSLQAIHLLIRANHIPETLVRTCFRLTLATQRTQSDDNATSDSPDILMLRETKTTLLHNALLHRSSSIELLRDIVAWAPDACKVRMQPNDELPLHLAARSDTPVTILKQLCELFGAACQAQNKKRELPIHLAITSPKATEEGVRVLLHYCPFVLTEPQERQGLRSLVMAANVPVPNAAVIRALLDHTPAQKLTATTNRRHVTPLYAVSMRKCSPAIAATGILREFETKFEELEDDESYFTAMAKKKHRKQHHCPTAAWPFPKILALMDNNPVDEAIIQRSLLAINEKLTHLMKANASAPTGTRASDGIPEPSSDNIVLETVTLNSEWMVVRRLHQTLYELPWNPRIQLLGQAALHKLLPTAYAKATYKARIDPYFDLQ